MFALTPATTTNAGKAYQKILQEGKASPGLSKGATISTTQLHKYLRQQQNHYYWNRLPVPRPTRDYACLFIYTLNSEVCCALCFLFFVFFNAKNKRVSRALETLMPKVCRFYLTSFSSHSGITKHQLFIPKGSFHPVALFMPSSARRARRARSLCTGNCWVRCHQARLHHGCWDRSTALTM